MAGMNKSEIRQLERTLTENKFDDVMSGATLEAVKRVFRIDEKRTFRYRKLSYFNNRVPELQKLKEHATKSFEPYAALSKKSLCESMGMPLSDSLYKSVKEEDKLSAFKDIFLVTGGKVARFHHAALEAALRGQKSNLPKIGYTGERFGSDNPYNLVFDRESAWTPWNEAGHMANYARYHFNSYVLFEAMFSKKEKLAPNPFNSVMLLYEKGAADFIFIQTKTKDGGISERLGTFWMIDTGDINVIGVLTLGDEKLEYYRNWGDHYHNIKILMESDPKIKLYLKARYGDHYHNIKGLAKEPEMEIIGVAKDRYLPAEYG